MNWLNDKKRADGRKPALAWQFEPMNLSKPPRAYSVDDFRVKIPKEAAKPSELAVSKVEIEPLPHPENLGDILPSDPERVEAIMTKENPPKPIFATRSELVFAAVIWMLSKGIKPAHVLSIIVSPDVAITARVLKTLTRLPTRIGKWCARWLISRFAPQAGRS